MYSTDNYQYLFEEVFKYYSNALAFYNIADTIATSNYWDSQKLLQ